MGVKRQDPKRASLIRLWVPLAQFDSRHFQIGALNSSVEARAERAAHNATLIGTNYVTSERLEKAAGGALLAKQMLDTSTIGRADVIAFDDESPHFAAAYNCSHAAGHCLRLILAFASGDNALFSTDRKPTMLPVSDNQTDGVRPEGTSFPTIYPHVRAWEWEPLRPSASAIFSSIHHGMKNGPAAFVGWDWSKKSSYYWRVNYGIFKCFWGYGDDCSLANVVSGAKSAAKALDGTATQAQKQGEL
jgi:hypothetical protein